MEYKSGERYFDFLAIDDEHYRNDLSYDGDVVSSSLTVFTSIGDDPLTEYSCRLNEQDVSSTSVQVEVLSKEYFS